MRFCRLGHKTVNPKQGIMNIGPFLAHRFATPRAQLRESVMTPRNGMQYMEGPRQDPRATRVAGRHVCDAP
jgi:hypothetical protein